MRGSDLLGRSAEAGANAPLGSWPQTLYPGCLSREQTWSPFCFCGKETLFSRFCGNWKLFRRRAGMEYDQIGPSAPAQHRRQKRWAASQRGQLRAGLLLAWVCVWWGSCHGTVVCQSGREPRMQLTAASSALRARGRAPHLPTQEPQAWWENGVGTRRRTRQVCPDRRIDSRSANAPLCMKQRPNRSPFSPAPEGVWRHIVDWGVIADMCHLTYTLTLIFLRASHRCNPTICITAHTCSG